MENKQEKILDDILEIVTFIKDHAMTKEEGVTKQEFNGFDKRVAKIEATMVTKDYLDEKLADMT